MKLNRKLIHWIAIFAIAMSALAPTISQAMSVLKSGQGFVVEICSTSGSKMTKVIGEEGTKTPIAKDGHCPYCIIQPLYDIPLGISFKFPEQVSSDRLILSFSESYRGIIQWISLPSRAPPTLS